jgi:hypothetical protein
MRCKRRVITIVSSWISSLSEVWQLVVMRGSKNWWVRKALCALHLILRTRLSIRVLLIIRLIPTSVHARLELGVLLDAQWGWDVSMKTCSRHKGTWEIGDLRVSASFSCRWLRRLEICYVTQVESGWSEQYRLRRVRVCRWTLLFLLLLLLLLLHLLLLRLRIVLWLRFHILLAKNVIQLQPVPLPIDMIKLNLD